MCRYGRVFEVGKPYGPARALALDRLAWAHARDDEAQAAMRALGEAGDRTTDRARVVLRKLGPYADIPQVRELLAGYPLGAAIQ
ncbi:hypothetical protein ABGB18_34935 [Nonomuraea sp. B12E4]|uniref:hypothetical protein n=1 Tax=Nonomuraea sp. B12E4 TaxID=3153564 RepID=UPI00325C7F2A